MTTPKLVGVLLDGLIESEDGLFDFIVVDIYRQNPEVAREDWAVEAKSYEIAVPKGASDEYIQARIKEALVKLSALAIADPYVDSRKRISSDNSLVGRDIT